MDQQDKINLFFHLNLFCNDKCDFCFYSTKHFKKGYLTLKDIKKTIKESGEKNIQGIVLTGGEPTINPYFWEIIGYLYENYIKTNKVKEFDLSTNAITCSDKKVARKIERYFSLFEKENNRIKISFSFSSFKDPRKQKIIDKKIRGIKNLMSINSNMEAVIVITRDNYKYIMKMTRLLIDLYNKKKAKNYFFKIDFRLPYILRINELDNFKNIVIPFREFSRVLNCALDLTRKKGIYVTLHNIPLCYIKNDPEYFIIKSPPRGVSILPGKEKDIIKINKLSSFNKGPECDKCKLSSRCSGIENFYQDKYSYSNFKKFI